MTDPHPGPPPEGEGAETALEARSVSAETALEARSVSAETVLEARSVYAETALDARSVYAETALDARSVYAKTLLEARNVSKAFGATRALSGASLALHEGELVGLVGADGAGKTSLIRALVGLVAIDAGTVTVGGVAWNEAGRGARESLGYMPQQYSLYPDLSVDENLTFFARLFGLKRDVFEERREQLLAMTLLDRARDRPAGKLSGGMYKKLAVACALLHRPRALVLDEPTNGVDPVSRRELWALLYEFVGQGMGVLMATPYMDEAARCGRVVLLSRGVVLAEGTPADLVASLGHPGDFEDFYLSLVDP